MYNFSSHENFVRDLSNFDSRISLIYDKYFIVNRTFSNSSYEIFNDMVTEIWFSF